jgi:hypothetical protein
VSPGAGAGGGGGGGGSGASADDLIIACCLEAAASAGTAPPGPGPCAAGPRVLLVTLDRALALRAHAAGVWAVEPRDLPRSRAGLAALAAEAAAAMAARPVLPPPSQHQQPPPVPLPPPPRVDPAALAALDADLDDALLAGLGPAAAACLAATHGPGALWTDLVPDPPPWTGPGGTGAVLANLRATWTSSIADWYGAGRGGRARAARDVADALAKARSAAGRARGGGRGGSHAPLEAALRAAAAAAMDLLSDFPSAGDAAAAAAVAAAREAVGHVAGALGLSSR